MCDVCGPDPTRVVDHEIGHPFELKPGSDNDCNICDEHLSIHPDKMLYLAKRERDRILEFGHEVRAVFPDEEGGTLFAYSVGRAFFDRPEFFVTGGLAPQTMQYMINRLADIDGETPVEAGDELNEVLEGLPVRLREIQDLEAAEMYGVTQKFPDARALQILWPDREGNLPGDANFDSTFEQDLP